MNGSREKLPNNTFKNNMSNGGDSLERLTLQDAIPHTASRETLRDEDDTAMLVNTSAKKISQYQQFMNAYSTEDLKPSMTRNHKRKAWKSPEGKNIETIPSPLDHNTSSSALNANAEFINSIGQMSRRRAQQSLTNKI